MPIKTKHATDLEWSAWTSLATAPAFSPAALRETLDGGQMFRFNQDANDVWTGVWGGNVARLRERDGGCIEASFPLGTERKSLPALVHLLALDRPYGEYYAALPRRIDPVLERAMSDCEGLRIVNMPLGEAILCFLCSPMKRIPQIKQALENIAQTFGRKLQPGIHALPTWEALAQVDELALRRCKLGYRAHSIAGTAQMLAQKPGFIDKVSALPYAEAREMLKELPGVGGKIADCVLLYSGAANLQPFPVDTWILKAMAKLYGLDGWEPEQLGQFGRAHFGNMAGLAQQFLFVYARKQKI
jgi:N-glycosylase/DNA lyase